MAEKKQPFDQHIDGKQGKKGGPKKRKRRTFLIIVLSLLTILLLGAGAAAAVIFNYIDEAPPIDPSRLETVETSYLYDINGVEITALHEEQNRIAVTLDEIPDHVRNAFIAIEDERFYSHFGFDIIASVRAAYINFRTGTIVQGASTITQQLAQNAFLTTETSYKRKIQEIWLAIQLERNYVKEEILELYLNRIYFGNGAYGVQAAAKTYFNKNADELTVAEAAMLAGAVRSPNFYNPINNKAEAEERMRLVLSSMHRLELIDDLEYEKALNQRMIYSQAPSQEYPFPHYVDYVVHHELIRLLSAIPSIGSWEEAYRAIYTGGLSIYTNLDPAMQGHVEEVLAREDLYPTTIYVDMLKVREAASGLAEDRDIPRAELEDMLDEENGIAQPQAAIVLADPVTGKIIALGGGREYRKKADEVLRFASLRQPGSAIKPIINYGPCFEEGVIAGAGATFDDSPFIGPRGDWFPENFDRQFRGMVTVREALLYSYNIPAIRSFEALGPPVGAAYAERMGISTLHPNEVENLSLTLGGLTYGVSAIDMAQAYSVLANNGIKVNLHTVEKIVDRHGDILYENRVEPQQILSPQSTFLVNDILQDFVTQYLGRNLQIDRPVAAKSGTTDNWKDVYMVAYTPNLVASFWMGYDEPKMGGIRQGWRYSTVFLREVFLEAFENLEIQEFERPEGIVQMTVCSKSGLIPNDSCRADESVTSDYFIAGSTPAKTCDMHIGMFYNRPPFIITDERWSGEPGRGPQDAEDRPSSIFGHNLAEQIGQTTSDFSLFNAFITNEDITLQWEYKGPPHIGFELIRTAHDGSDSDMIIELDPDTRQFSDADTEPNTVYIYTLAALYPEGLISDPATLSISTARLGDGGIFLQPSAQTTIVPDVVGSFQAVAELNISRAGLTVGRIERDFDESLMQNMIISQVPAGGSIVREGTRVDLVVSKGKPPGSN